MVHAMGIRLTMVRSLSERAEDKGEERRGGPPDGAGVWVAMFPKGEKEKGEGGSSRGDEAWESRADQMLGKEKVHSAQGRRVRHDAAATRKRGAKDPIQTAFVGHAVH